MKRSSSLRLRRPKPMGRSADGAAAISGLLVLGGPAGRRDDVLVPGASADAAGDGGADLVLGRIRVLVEQGADRHLHPRRAEAALEGVHLVEPLLDRVELAPYRERLDRADLVAGGH